MPAFIDLTGQVFTDLTVVDRAPDRNDCIQWNCQCICGNMAVAYGMKLKSGQTKSCGCYKQRNKMSGEERRAARLATLRKYDTSDHGKAAKNAYQKSDIGKESHTLANKKYLKTEQGKLIRKQIMIKYEATPKGKYKSVKSSAKQRNLSLEFNLEEYTEFFYHKTCYICGTDSTGVDRVDSSLGYVLSNCQPCCWPCNEMKNDSTVEAFKIHLVKVYNHFILGGTPPVL